MDLAAITKSAVGFLGGMGKSKKLGLVTTLLVACFLIGTQAALYCATAAVVAYLIGQSLVEASAAWSGHAAPTANGEDPKKT